jgi:hypothetical protein
MVKEIGEKGKFPDKMPGIQCGKIDLVTINKKSSQIIE